MRHVTETERTLFEIMDRKTRPTICETIISKTWHLLKREISLDNDVKLMISEGIITENEVTDIKKDNEGEHQKIVNEILFSIQKQGSRGMHPLLEILKSNGNTEIFDALIKASVNKDANCNDCNCEKLKFLEAQDIKAETKERDQGSISSSEIANMSHQISKLMEKSQKTSKPEVDDGFIEEMHQTNHQIQSSVSSSTVLEEISKMRVELGEITGLRRDFETEKIRVNEKLLVMEQKNEDLETEIKKLQSMNKELSECMNDLRKQVEDLTIKLNESEKEHQKLKKENNELRAQVESLITELKEKKQENHQLETKNNELKEDLIQRDHAYAESMQTINKEKEELEKDLQEKTDDYAHLQNLQQNIKEKENDRFKNVQLLLKKEAELNDKLKKAVTEKNEAEERLQAQDNKVKEDEMRQSHELSLLKNEIKEQGACIDGLQKEKDRLADKLQRLEIEKKMLNVDNKRLIENLHSLQKPLPGFNSVTKTQGKEPNHRRLPQGSRGGRGGPKGKK